MRVFLFLAKVLTATRVFLALGGVFVAFAPPVYAGGLEDDLQNGRQLYREKNQARIAKLIPDAHPVAQPMLQYWGARLLLQKGKIQAADDFIRQHPATHLAAELQRDLLRHLADKKDWGNFNARAENAGNCANLLRLQNVKEFPAPRELKILWDNDDKFNDPLCNRVHKNARKGGVVTDEDVWLKLRRVAGRKQYSATRNLLRHFPVARYSAVRKIMRAPVRHIRGKHGLRTRLNRELVMIAAMAAVRTKPSVAISRWRAFSKYFSADENNDVHAVLAEWAARWGRKDAPPLFRKAPREVYDESARAWRVRAALRAGDFGDVAETIDSMPPEEKVVTAWRYWRAFAARETGDAETARAVWKELTSADDYYGLLAREELGLPLVNPAATPDPSPNGKPPAEALLALGLRAIGLDEFARRMWRRATSAAPPADRLAAARAAAAAQWHLAAIYAADGVPGAAAHSLRFPQPYSETIDKYADDRGLDRAFVYGLIRQESRFMPKIVSSAKARGLMQVMPATAKRVARRHRYGKYRLSRLTRVDTNVIIGTRYLADLGGSLGNHPVLMAAGYNAGPGRAKRWTKRGGEWLVYIETIPITETRLYVKHVLANRAHYDYAMGRASGGKMREVILRPANRGGRVSFRWGIPDVFIPPAMVDNVGVVFRRNENSGMTREARGGGAKQSLAGRIPKQSLGTTGMTAEGRSGASRDAFPSGAWERQRGGDRGGLFGEGEEGAEFGEEFGVVAGVAPHSVFGAAEVEAAGLCGNPQLAHRRLAVDNHRGAVVGMHLQHAADGVKVNSGVVQKRFNFGENFVAKFVKFGLVHHDGILT